MPLERTALLHLGVVTPMANEEDTAVSFVERVLVNCRSVPHTNLFVVLDNASKDGTRALLEEYARKDSRLRVVWSPENRCVVDASMCAGTGKRYGQAATGSWKWMPGSATFQSRSPSSWSA
jgi:hypothetical protein